MREHSIRMRGHEVRAILDGRKVQTRRAVKLRYPWEIEDRDDGSLWPWHPDYVTGGEWDGWATCPYGQPGDRLWVKHAANLFPVYFKPIAGWEGLYAAGTDGVIYRMDRGEPQPLKPSLSSKGYSTVSLSRGTWETHAVHRLVCEAFYGPPPAPGAQVRHMDGDRSNSDPANLDWGTHAENWQDRKGHGGGMGEAHHGAKLDCAAVAEIRSSLLSQRALARKFGVSQATVSDARLGKTWGKHQCGERNLPSFSTWKSPIHMPRWACRIVLEITDMRVERLQAISDADALAEGVDQTNTSIAGYARQRFQKLWTSTGGDWDANPWVWVIAFRRVEAAHG